MVSKFIKTMAMILLIPSFTFSTSKKAFAQASYTNWIEHPYYGGSKSISSDRGADLMSKMVNGGVREIETMDTTNSVPRIEKFDFKTIAGKDGRPYAEDKIGQTYYQIEDFKDDLTSEVNKKLKSVGMRAKIDFKKVSLRLWQQNATQRNVDFSKPLTLYYSFDKKLEAESKYGSRYGIYFTLTGHFEDFRQLFGFGKE